ncbi:MAG: pseudouridine synthase [Candidatus Doudnabacteria bacterium CG10_big_fil_rev_8_21_14_0_10_42_18]|uniref:Pseudouridine synthase n=1 Tax=Candidatus Doudnabacteria bacterium CG10_big_fil_rev_8_21_14_0_10_42_18 TaxID=1974552 RepID=A0A2H0VAN0_9BACT|nr:MAG: pseudouridine synthase [Candidatus Doudnabacteria bacterium CG10_big_fil_rev_8_21_14_0_10_42_18]
MERVQKFISSSGVASRRKAEEFIRSGQVLINGKKAKLGDKVDPLKDEVKIYGKRVKSAEAEKIYLILNKPKNCVVTKSDPQGRATVYKFLPDDVKSKVWSIGRLDYKTEGLIILTNDGDLTNQLTHPRFEHEKEYEAATNKEPTQSQIEKLEKGVKLSTGITSPAKARYKNSRLYITIHEGKKHQIRRMLDAVGLDVLNLKRVRVGNLKLPSNLPPGQFKKIKKEDIL